MKEQLTMIAKKIQDLQQQLADIDPDDVSQAAQSWIDHAGSNLSEAQYQVGEAIKHL